MHYVAAVFSHINPKNKFPFHLDKYTHTYDYIPMERAVRDIGFCVFASRFFWLF